MTSQQQTGSWWMRSLLLVAAVLNVASQPGFTSINCGGELGGDFVAPGTSISWQADGRFITTGSNSQVDAARSPGTLPAELKTLRVFAAGSSPNKNCYVLPVELSSINLIRVGFFYGNYDLRRAATIQFKLSVDATLWQDVSIDGKSASATYYEVITAPAVDSTVSVCLTRTTLDAPFVNSLEVRALSSSRIYTRTLDSRVNLHLLSRINFGEQSISYRYPEDPFDRIWSPYLQVVPSLQPLVIDMSAPPGQLIDNSQSGRDNPPSAVMRTAVTGSVISYTRPISVPAGSVIFMYQMFAELNVSADMRIMDYTSTLQTFFSNISLTPLNTKPFQTYQFGYQNSTLMDGSAMTVTLVRDPSSKLDPLVNADELYTVHSVSPGTHPADVSALKELKALWNLSYWVGDPCQPVPWDELACVSDNVTVGSSNVTSLDLSGENLSGDLPPSIAKLTSIVNLNLAENALTGQLPNSFTALAALEVLDVSNNMIGGTVPTWLEQLPSLKRLDISNNSFSGSIPPLLIQRLGSNFQYSGNLQLHCGGESGCVPTAAPAANPKASEDLGTGKKRNLTVPAIAGGVSLAIFLILLAGGLYYCCQARGKRAKTSGVTHVALSNAKSVRDVGEHQYVSRGRLKVFSAGAVKEATKNYTRKIGQGGFGPVYYGVIGNKKEVAVKVLSGTSSQGLNEFSNEVELLSLINHKNLVRIVGYCHQGTQLILLYEYMAGGDLKNRLYGRDAAVNPLDWRTRLEIAKGAAEGLEYLHHGCKPSIIHRDVKSSNILLTHKMEAKVADFGLSKRTPGEVDHVTTMVKGTTGYLDPHYYRSGLLTEKSDVYSFGVVLMEILCGRPSILLDGPNVAPHQRGILEFMRTSMQTGDVGSFLDSSIGTEYSPEAVFKVAELAVGCVNMSHRSRPNMRDVVRRLEIAIELEEAHAESRSQASPYKYPDTYPISHNWHTRRPSAASDSGM